ncbi:hypothetical protein AB0H81_41340, partial [Nonomuraea sp. NPDC050691]
MIAELLAEMPGARVFLAGIAAADLPRPQSGNPSGNLSGQSSGNPSGDDPAGAPEPVDLDRDLLEPLSAAEQAAEVLVLARTPADLRRAATLHKLLPETRRVVVAVLDTPPSHPAPVPTPTPAHRWRSLSDLRVHRPKDRVWVVDAHFSAPTPAGRTVTATSRAFAGHRLDV